MHLCSVNDLSDQQVIDLIQKSLKYEVKEIAIQAHKTATALIFLEPSTRTRVSFERAAQLTGRRYILINNLMSSMEKGETLEDTVANLHALGLGMFVIRNSSEASIKRISDMNVGVVINAGDGVNEHPTQALLDLATLYQRFDGKLRGLKVAIAGDLRHSRVAKSFVMLAPRFGVQVYLAGPQSWKPYDWGADLPWSENLDEVLKQTDAIMALRVQRERMDNVEKVLVQNYVRDFQLTRDRLGKNQVLMHPGPVNWGVELNPDLRGDSRSLILRQAAIGLSLRAVILDQFDPAIP